MVIHGTPAGAIASLKAAASSASDGGLQLVVEAQGSKVKYVGDRFVPLKEGVQSLGLAFSAMPPAPVTVSKAGVRKL